MERIGETVKEAIAQMGQEPANTTKPGENQNTELSQDKPECDCEFLRIRGRLDSHDDHRRWLERNHLCPNCQPIAHKKWAEEEGRRKKEELEKHKKWLHTTSAIPLRMQKQNFENYQVLHSAKGQEATLNKCRDFAENFPKHAEAGKWLLLTGPCGTGKGHLAAAIADTVIEKHTRAVYYIKLIDLVGQIKDTWNRKDGEETEETILKGVRGVDLLILDEIGVQFGSEAERLYLYRVLDNRYEWLRPTILTTNLTLDQLKKVAGARVIDRLCEPPSETLFFNWPSYRQTIKK